MKHIVSQMSSYFPNRWPLSYLNLIKNMKTYIRRQQHKKKLKHQDIKQKEPPQKYRLGAISNTKLLAGLNRLYRILTSPSDLYIVTETYTDRRCPHVDYDNDHVRNCRCKLLLLFLASKPISVTYM